MKPLHEQIRSARRLLGLRQADLAARAGIAKESLTRIERGRTDPQESTLEALALGLDAALLVVPRSRLSEVLKLIEAPSSPSELSAGSTYDDVFIPDPTDDDA
jgi:transcriptional regulator with XRE-family HTH domain